jgi:hypothetical protein
MTPEPDKYAQGSEERKLFHLQNSITGIKQLLEKTHQGK